MRVDVARLADELRTTCIQTVLSAYEDAGISGLCTEGRIEYAADALRQLDVERIVRAHILADADEPSASNQQEK